MKKTSALLLVPILLIAMLLASCGDYRKVTIGLSMAGTGNWSRQLYEEVKIACMQYPGVRLISTNAYENQDLQERQMDSLIDAHSMPSSSLRTTMTVTSVYCNAPRMPAYL